MGVKTKNWKDKIELGAYLRSLRVTRSLNQHQAAEQLGCSEQTVSLLERGGTQPGVSLLRSVTDLYGLNLEDLLNVFYPPGKREWKNKQD